MTTSQQQKIIKAKISGLESEKSNLLNDYVNSESETEKIIISQMIAEKAIRIGDLEWVLTLNSSQSSFSGIDWEAVETAHINWASEFDDKTDRMPNCQENIDWFKENLNKFIIQ